VRVFAHYSPIFYAVFIHPSTPFRPTAGIALATGETLNQPELVAPKGHRDAMRSS